MSTRTQQSSVADLLEQTEEAWLTEQFYRNRKRPEKMSADLRWRLVAAMEAAIANQDVTADELQSLSDLRQQTARTLADFMGDSQNWQRYLDLRETTLVANTAQELRQALVDTTAQLSDLHALLMAAERVYSLATNAGRLEDHSERIPALVGFYVPAAAILQLGALLEAARREGA
jgi:hypothetical protein